MTAIDVPTTRPKKKLSGEVALVTLAQIAEQAGVIVLTMLLARLLSVQEYGSFRQLWMVHRTLLQIFSLGIAVSVAYYLPKLVLRRQRGMVARSSLFLLGVGICVTAGMYVGADAMARWFNNPDLAPLLRLFGVYTAILLPAGPLRAVMVNHGRSRDLAIFILCDQAVLLAVAGGTVLLGGDLTMLSKALVVVACVRLAAALWLIFYTLRGGGGDGGGRVPMLTQLLFALPNAVSVAFDALNVMLDKFVAATFFSIEDFARYANGAFHIPLVSTVVDSVSMVLLPEYVRYHARGDVEGILRLWHKSIRATAVLFLPLVAFLLVYAEPFVTLMFSAKYTDSAMIFQVYILALLPRMTSYAYVLIGMGYSREQVVASLISLVVNLVASVVLVYQIGVFGPALGTVLADLCLAGYYLMRIKRAMHVSLRAVFPWAMLAKIALISGAAAVMCWPVLWLDLHYAPVTLVVGGVLFAGLFLLIARLTGQVSPDDIELFRGMLRRRKADNNP